MKAVISIGNQDFVSIRKNHCFYIDKTDFIRKWWENLHMVILKMHYCLGIWNT